MLKITFIMTSHWCGATLCLVLAVLLVFPLPSAAMTSIKVVNEWSGGIGHTDVNVKIAGEGVGGCDIVLKPASNGTSRGWVNSTACECLWGTVGYKFHVYVPSLSGAVHERGVGVGAAEGSSVALRGGGAAAAAAAAAAIEIPICSDLSGLGNCYDGSYTCTLTADKLCHCHSD